jgi:hypothetical protein
MGRNLNNGLSQFCHCPFGAKFPGVALCPDARARTVGATGRTDQRPPRWIPKTFIFL